LAGIALLLPAVDGLPLPGYAAIALILIGAVFMMPIVTHLLLRSLPDSRSVVLGLVVVHLRGTRRFVSASLASILVSFSLMVAMAIMVTSFRTSLDQWMAKLLQADIYVRAGFGQESAFIDQAQLSALRSIDGVTRVQAARSLTILFNGERLVLAARPIDEVHPEKDLWLVSQTSLAQPPGTLPIWISEAAMDLNHLAPGTEVEIPIEGRATRAFIRGVWRDYEHQSGAIAMNYDMYVRVSGDRRVDGVRLWLQSMNSKNAVLQELERRLPNAAILEIRFPIDVRATALRAFDRTFAVTYLLEALAVMIGIFGIGATTSAQVLARRAEFGVLRSLGLTRRQIGTMLAVEGGTLGLLGVVAGLLLGWLISFILVYVVNRQSFHWSMDVYIPAATLLTLSVVLVSAAAVTARWSGRRAMSDEVIKAIKEDW
jgi:putative ABC transport system permease protein